MRSGRRDILPLLGLAVVAFLIHGYHPFSEDAETYLPGIERLLNPQLFPIGSEYFQLHAHLTWFPQLIGYSARILHVRLEWALLFWQVASFFLFLLACWDFVNLMFPRRIARWAGVSLIAVLFTMPVAGTALYVMDPFLNPRNITAFAEVLAVTSVVRRRYWIAVPVLIFAGSIHPLMTAFTASLCALVVGLDRIPEWLAGRGAFGESIPKEQSNPALPAAVGIASVNGIFSAPTEAYDRVAASHRYQFLVRWTWYELVGAVAPIFLFLWFSSLARARGMRNLDLLSRAIAIFTTIYFVLGLAVSIPHRLEVFSLLQPMRSLRIVYILMILIGGGLVGEYVLRNRIWRWICLFLPLSAGMCWAQRALYPASPHLELPSDHFANPWAQAFLWARENTPSQAIFALDPFYMNEPGEDSHGFRAIAQRSRLADGTKDSGVVELFPEIANSWMRQVQAQTGIDQFTHTDFERLKDQFDASWVILHTSNQNEIPCPYRNSAVMVCRIP
ncbi:hypothetical protein DYQ86_01445 [Acidobacteria bacterium AB60]|nr:hypothetical protein DYQ86_01445 [Acidobacteria bacterium AB60]